MGKTTGDRRMINTCKKISPQKLCPTNRNKQNTKLHIHPKTFFLYETSKRFCNKPKHNTVLRLNTRNSKIVRNSKLVRECGKHGPRARALPPDSEYTVRDDGSLTGANKGKIIVFQSLIHQNV